MISKIKSIRKKIYYVPGLISLIFLPIIFFAILPSTKTFTVFNYVVPTSSKTTSTWAYSGENFMKQMSKKKIITFYLSNDHEFTKEEFTIIKLEVLKSKFTCDTNHVIAIHFSDSLYYGEFIRLLNMMYKYQFKRYGEWKNIFYIFGEEPPDPNEIQPIYL